MSRTRSHDASHKRQANTFPPSPTDDELALAPELAVLVTLDAALAASVEQLQVAHSYELDALHVPEERLALHIIIQAGWLRDSLAHYRRLVGGASDTATNEPCAAKSRDDACSSDGGGDGDDGRPTDVMSERHAARRLLYMRELLEISDRLIMTTFEWWQDDPALHEAYARHHVPGARLARHDAVASAEGVFRSAKAKDDDLPF